MTLVPAPRAQLVDGEVHLVTSHWLHGRWHELFRPVSDHDAIVLRDSLHSALTTLHGERERVTADSFCRDCQKPLSAHTKCSGCEHFACDCICEFLRDEWPTHHANPDADGERSGRVTA